MSDALIFDFDASSFHCLGCYSDYGHCPNHVAGELTEQAQRLAYELLPNLPHRLAHTLAVGSLARDMVAVAVDRGNLSGKVADIAGCVGTLHDIGYSDQCVSTGMHAYDGAAWLEGRGFPKQIVGLVAFHSTSKFECQLAGLDLGRFESVHGSYLSDVIWAADFMVSPFGVRVSPDVRIAEIKSRYGSGSRVIQALEASISEFESVLKRLDINHNDLS